VAAAEELSAWDRFSHLRRTVVNWPLVVPDKLGLRHLCRYRTRTGLTVWCRGRSTDVNELVVVLGELEYPSRYLHVDAGSTVLDLGANIGSFALLLHSLHPDVPFRGVAFEPFPENFELLERNLAANDVRSFRAERLAISAVDGDVRLRTDRTPDTVTISDEGEGMYVPSRRLSTYCSEHEIDRIDLLKLDVEGAEHEIVDGDYAFLCSAAARVLVEYHDLDDVRTLDSLVARMRADFEIDVIHMGSLSGVFHARNRAIAGMRVATVAGR
jgi:FkbM family methyltransferase